MQTTHTNRSQSRGKSYVSHVKNEIDMQCEIDELKKKLRCARRRRLSPESESSSEDTDDATGDDPELRPVKLSRATRNIVIVGIRIRASRTRALEIKP